MPNEQKWKEEYLFVRRDDNGLIIAISENTPKDYAIKVAEEQNKNPRILSHG